MDHIETGNWGGLPWEQVGPGMERRPFAPGSLCLSCWLYRVHSGHRVCPHSHPEEQVTLVLSGECDYYVDNKPYHLTAGSWITVPGGVEHYIHSYGSSEPCLEIDILDLDSPADTEELIRYLAAGGRGQHKTWRLNLP